MKTSWWTSTIAGLALVLAVPVHAQFVVIDPANLIQTTITAIRSAIQIANQIQSLENEAVMLENEAKNLSSLNFNSLGRLQAILATVQRLLNQSQGLSLQLAQASQQFARLYPNSYAGASINQMMGDRAQHWTNSHEALRTTVQVQAQSQQNFASDQGVIADLVAQSQGAVGALQAAQATNQLLALHAKQLIQAQQMAIAQDRVTALEHARAVEAEARANEMRRDFMTQQTNYGPVNVTVFPGGR
jgi:type IV secretion system protein TrbJ